MIYLDNNSTTKLDPRVLEAMLPFLQDQYANAASNHEFGVSVNGKIKDARSSVAELIGCEANEIIFTSGATEGVNLAIKGIADFYSGKSKHIITSNIEHPAVLDSCKYLETKGFEISYLPAQANGIISVNDLKKAIRKDTLLVCVMLVNNEIGTIQPVKDLAKIAHKNGSIFMSDATQAIGKIAINVDKLGIDILAFSAHKFHGPKGIGALFVRGRQPHKIKLSPLLHGGGHEKTFRSGTLNVPGIIGLGKAAEIALKESKSNQKLIESLRVELEKGLLKIKKTSVNGDRKNRLYNVTNICFLDADADAMIAGLDGIIVSNGAACSSAKSEASHVLKAIGRSDREAYSSIRFSISKFNTRKEIKIVLQEVKTLVSKLRKMNKS